MEIKKQNFLCEETATVNWIVYDACVSKHCERLIVIRGFLKFSISCHISFSHKGIFFVWLGTLKSKLGERLVKSMSTCSRCEKKKGQSTLCPISLWSNIIRSISWNMMVSFNNTLNNNGRIKSFPNPSDLLHSDRDDCYLSSSSV